MTPRDLLIVALLCVGCLVALAGGIGVLAARGFYDRLHFVGMTTVAALPLAVAVALGEASVDGIAKALFVGGIVLAVGPVLTHAMARAELNRQHRAAAAREADERRRRKAG